MHARPTRACMAACPRRGHYSDPRDKAAKIPGRKCRSFERVIDERGPATNWRSSAARRRRGVALSRADDEVGGTLMIVCMMGRIEVGLNEQGKACATVSGRRCGAPAA